MSFYCPQHNTPGDNNQHCGTTASCKSTSVFHEGQAMLICDEPVPCSPRHSANTPLIVSSAPAVSWSATFDVIFEHSQRRSQHSIGSVCLLAIDTTVALGSVSQNIYTRATLPVVHMQALLFIQHVSPSMAVPVACMVGCSSVYWRAPMRVTFSNVSTYCI